MQYFLDVLWILLVCSTATSAYGKEDSFEEDENDRVRLEQFITDVMEEHGVPGMTVAIVKDGKPYMAEGFGLADVEQGTPVTNDTLMYTASTGKAFTAALVTKVLDKYSEYVLDTPVRAILDEEFEVNDGYRRFHINVRDLLSHRTDIQTSFAAYAVGAMEDREDMLYRSRFFRPLTEFRSEFQYNDLWYSWAGHTAERITGIKFEELMTQEILAPLGMYDTQYISLMPEEEYDRMATPYYLTDDGLREVTWDAYSCVGPENPSGGMVSNAKDMQQWLIFQTSGGRNADGDVVLEEELWKETIKANIPINYKDPSKIQPQSPVMYSEDDYGLGWNVGYYRGYPIQTHGGSWWGFWSRASVMADMDMGFYMVANGPWYSAATAALKKIELFAMDLFLGEEPWVNVTTPMSELPDSYKEPHEQRWNEQEQLMDEKYGLETIMKLVRDHESLLKSKEDIMKTDPEPRLTKAKYAGTYGTYCCGNATVTHNSFLDTLSMTYGDCGNIDLVELVPEEDVFLMVVKEPFWFAPPTETLQFFSDDGGETINSLVIPYILWSDPPVMYRDLDMDSQPPMPEDCDQ